MCVIRAGGGRWRSKTQKEEALCAACWPSNTFFSGGLIGKKLDNKKYYHHTGYPGGLKETSYRDLLSKKPEFAVYEAIRRMMPKGPLGRQMLKKVRIYAGAEHKNAAQMPETLVLK